MDNSPDPAYARRLEDTFNECSKGRSRRIRRCGRSTLRQVAATRDMGEGDVDTQRSGGFLQI